MKKKSENNFSLAVLRLYPHFKLTRERFPRLLATRKIAEDGAEYFGAFLPETGVRFLIHFLNKTFRLRTCEIDIDGSFDVPCTQFYRRRCVAPCVSSLCDEQEYAERVELVRLLLQRKTGELENHFLKKIEKLAEDLEFEKASELHENWQEIEKILSEKKWNFWLDDALDTFEIVETENEYLVYLVTMRGRKTLGKRVFVFGKTGGKEKPLQEILRRFYRFHAPKEIRVSEDFTGRLSLAKELSRRFGRQIKIVVARESETKVFTNRALNRNKYEHEFRQIKRFKSFDEIQSDLQMIFALSRKPRRLEGFDVAHISGKDFVAAKSVWENGKFLGKEYEFWFSGEESELETLRKFIELRFTENTKIFPDLILIDGGRAHLQAALNGLKNFPERKFSVVSAVKPRGQHGEISHFLTENGRQINFDGENPTHRVLRTLRDEAHDLSNEIHRQRREMSHFYELAAALPSLNESERRALLKTAGSIGNLLGSRVNKWEQFFSSEKADLIRRDLENYRNGKPRRIEPLIVPLRYTDENGDAQDLRPLENYRVK